MRTVNPSTSLRINGERSRTVKFYTLGCKVNQYETQEIRERFLEQGFKEVDNAKRAAIFVINTCTVTHRADCDSFNLLRRAERENPRAKIIVTGCLTELDQSKIKKTVKNCLIVKNRDKGNILSFLNQRTNEPAPRLRSGQANRRTAKGISRFAGHTRAFLKIQDGCNNFCSYCKVPLVRGCSISKPLNDIIKEAGNLAENGFKEIVLCGICLGSYCHCEESATELWRTTKQSQDNLVDVIGALENIDGLLRIRLSSIEPQDVTEELIEKIRVCAKICRHLHIPLQSGDDAILKKMNRKYTSAEYLELIRRIKKRVGGIAITTDVMVGFPGENEDNFNNTRELVKKIMPLKVHLFAYSRREGTAAAALNGQLSPQAVKKRLSELKAIADTCSFTYRNRFLGKRTDVLIEGRAKNNPSFWEGCTGNYLKVLLKSKSDLRNKLIPVSLQHTAAQHILAVAPRKNYT